MARRSTELAGQQTILPTGLYRYEIRLAGQIVAREDTTFDGHKIVGWRQSAEKSDRSEVDAEVSDDGFVIRLHLRYLRGPFSRNATYEAREEFMRGSVSALGGRNAVTAKLGRFREINADFTIFRALTLAHVRACGQTRWTGRVANIDSATLVAASNKQSARATDASELKWIYEPRMGDVEEIKIDAAGRILWRRDNRGGAATLVSD